MLNSWDLRGPRANQHWGGRFCAILLGLSAIGCDDSAGDISGKVFYQGRPLTAADAMVTFVDLAGRLFTSPIACDGSYELSKVPMGEMKIGVLVLEPRNTNPVQAMTYYTIMSGALNMSVEERDVLSKGYSPRESQMAIPAFYGDPEKSGLKYEVTGGQQTYDIDLK